MHRTQLLIPDELWVSLKTTARQEGRSVSSLIREMITSLLAAQPQPKKRPLDELIGVIKDEVPDLSRRYKDYLYGEIREPRKRA